MHNCNLQSRLWNTDKPTGAVLEMLNSTPLPSMIFTQVSDSSICCLTNLTSYMQKTNIKRIYDIRAVLISPSYSQQERKYMHYLECQ